MEPNPKNDQKRSTQLSNTNSTKGSNELEESMDILRERPLKRQKTAEASNDNVETGTPFRSYLRFS